MKKAPEKKVILQIRQTRVDGKQAWTNKDKAWQKTKTRNLKRQRRWKDGKKIRRQRSIKGDESRHKRKDDRNDWINEIKET